MTTVKSSIRYIVTFFLMTILLTGLLVLAAFIPQNAIRGNVGNEMGYEMGYGFPDFRRECNALCNGAHRGKTLR